MLFYGLLASSLIVHTQSAITGEWDDANRDSYEPTIGRECSQDEEQGTPGLNFYVDVFREKVYAFNFKGCGGDENMYSDYAAAEKHLPTDSAQCEGFNMSGWPQYGNSESEYKCPAGSSYLPYGEISAICCDDDTAARYREEKQLLCPRGEEPLTHLVIYKNADDEIEREDTRRLIGRNCSHNFCPETHFCWQGEFEAFCCPPAVTEAPTDAASEGEEMAEAPAAFEVGTQESPRSLPLQAVAEEGVVSIWILMMGVVAFVAVVGSVFVWRRKSSSSSRRFAFDEKEITALNP